MIEKTFTKKDLKKQVGCPGYVVDYLYDAGRLPVATESKGPGHARRYKVAAVEVLQAHIQRNQ